MNSHGPQLVSPIAKIGDGQTYLFPDSKPAEFSESQIETLVQRISISDENTREGDIPGGYTYIGQFVAHDLLQGRDTKRTVLPHLNLDSVYGHGAEREQVPKDKDGRFVLGKPDSDGQVVDLLRDKDGTARIPEARNDDNVIVAQVHLMFQKIHNALIDRLLPAIGCGEAAGAAARMINVYLYHRLLIDDFLPRILAPRVADFLLMRGERFLLRGDLEAVPQEFSRAAFRFGHSMVRQRYTLLNGGSFSLDQLLRRGQPIPAQMALDWDSLFGSAGSNFAAAIDTELAAGLTRVVTDRGVLNLAEMNIRASIGLAPGPAILELLRPPMTHSSIWQLGLESITPLDIYEVTGLENADAWDLPLWLYFLIEAMSHQRRRARPPLCNGRLSPLSNFPGRSLGPLASLIAGEVLLAGMRTAPFGAFSDQRRASDDLPKVARAELNTLLLRLGRVTVQGLVREFPSIAFHHRKPTMTSPCAQDFSDPCVEGAAVPGGTKCEVDALKAYHPPAGEDARNFVTRLCRLDSGNTSESPEDGGFRMPGAFKLEAVSGWNANSALLMASLQFRATYDGQGKRYFLATGWGQGVGSHKLTSWRIDTEDDGDVTRYTDVLNWTDNDGNVVITEWIWDHPKQV